VSRVPTRRPSARTCASVRFPTQRVEVRSRETEGWLVKRYGPGDAIDLRPGVRFTVDEIYAK
jgi:hypothetical protein